MAVDKSCLQKADFAVGRGNRSPYQEYFFPRIGGGEEVKTDEQQWVSLIVPPFDVSATAGKWFIGSIGKN
jgi:hypothetical protein